MNYGTKMFFKNFFTICIVIVFSSSNLFAQRHLRGKLIKQDTWKNKKLEYVSDELCVFIKQGKTKKEVLELFSKFQGKLGREIDKDFLVIVFPDSTDIISIAKQLKDNPLLKAIEPNAVGRALLSPNDTYFQNGKQWALYNYGQNPPNGASGADIDIKKAWDLTSASKADMVAVLDSGIPIVNGNLSHEDLDDANRFILGNDYSGENDNSVKDKYGHGSHVLGILGAETNNNKGIAGVVYDGTFLIVQVFDEEGIGDAPGFYLGVKYAVDNGAKVINASVGYSYTGMSALEAAVIHAKNNNVIIAAAAGNDEIYDDIQDIMYPAQYADGYNNVIAVSSTNADDQMSSFSNYNSSSTKIFAPGGYGEPFGTNDIYSTTPNYSFDIGGQYGTSITYGYMAGTSQATPLVAGVAALILAINNLSPLQVRTIISNTGDLIYDNTLNGNISRLNAYEALKYTLENYGGTIGGSGRTVTFHEDITIESGKTLTIATGTTVKFEPNDGLTVEGTLIADGVTFTSTSTSKWDGIFMDGASSSSVIKNCTITKAKTGIWLDDTDMTVEKNEIYNTSDYGIYIYGCSPKITDNYIHDTDDYGIAVNGSSTPYIRENSIKECEGGVFGFGAQSLKMIGYYGNYYGKNEIEDYEDEGVLITGGTPDLGLWGGASYKYGYNNIIKGSGSVVKNTTSSEVSAEKNYWGGTPQSYWFSGDFSWIKYLTSPYVYAGSSLEKIMDIEPDKLMLLDASELTDSKSYQLSSDKFKQLISEYPDSKYAGIALAWSMIAHNKAKDLGSQRGYLDEQIYHRNEKVRNSALLWLQILEAYVGNKEAAEKVVNSTSIKDAIGVEIRLNFANDLLNKFNDNHMAETIFSEIVKYDDSPPILRTIEAIKKTARNSKSDTFVKEGIEKEMDDILLVNENSLLDAYPNPFNPSTTINYKLQQKSNVSLIIYNSIGQEVAVLVNQQKEQGIHSVDFNASNLPSGLYIYRLQVHGQNGKNNYVQAKKMILMK